MWGAAIGGLAGGLLGGGGNVLAAERQIRFQREMAKNRYQYLVGDLEKAGLNRMLAIGGASPPTVPPGAKADVGSGIAGGASGVSKAIERRKQAAELGLLRWQTELAISSAANQGAMAQEALQRGKALRYENVGRKLDADYYSTDVGEAGRYIERFMNNIGGLGKGLRWRGR